MRDTWSRRCAVVLIIVVLAASWLTVGPAAAQETAGDGLVARVSTGSCEAPSPDDLAGFTPATPEAGGSNRSAVSFAARVDLSIAELLASPHALVLEQVDGNIATTYACGEIAADGEPDRIVIALDSVDTGGLAGVAVASAHDDGGTSIVVFLMLGDDAPAGADPAASDDDGALDEPLEPDDERDATEGGV